MMDNNLKAEPRFPFVHSSIIMFMWFILSGTKQTFQTLSPLWQRLYAYLKNIYVGGAIVRPLQQSQTPIRGDESLSKIGLLLSKRKQKQTNLSSMKHLLKPGANELLVQTRQANILLLLFGRTTFCLLTPRSKCFCLSRISHLRGSRVPVCTFLHALIFTQSLSEKGNQFNVKCIQDFISTKCCLVVATGGYVGFCIRSHF